MSKHESVSRFIADLKHGENESMAQNVIWSTFFNRLVALADQKLQCVPVVDGEDIAVSVLRGYFEQPNRYPVNDRDSLWPLLAKIATRKSISAFRQHIAQKRGGGNVFSESLMEVACRRDGKKSLDDLITHEVTSEFADETFSQIRDLMEMLESADPSLYQVAVLKLKGYKTSEIAKELGCVRRTVERKVKVIQELWASENLEDERD